MFRNLCRNDEFKQRFVLTFMDLVNTSFAEENIDPIISEYITLMEEPMPRYLKRFFGTEDESRFIAAVEDVQRFFHQRKPYIVQHLKDDFGLKGVLAPVMVSINDKDAGKVIVNTAQIPFDEACIWKGEYYTDYPITITVVANEGYHFVRWEDDIPSENEEIEVNIGECGVELKAIFERDEG